MNRLGGRFEPALPGYPVETAGDIKVLKLGQNLKIKKVSSLKSSQEPVLTNVFVTIIKVS